MRCYTCLWKLGCLILAPPWGNVRQDSAVGRIPSLCVCVCMPMGACNHKHSASWLKTSKYLCFLAFLLEHWSYFFFFFFKKSAFIECDLKVLRPEHRVTLALDNSESSVVESHVQHAGWGGKVLLFPLRSYPASWAVSDTEVLHAGYCTSHEVQTWTPLFGPLMAVAMNSREWPCTRILTHLMLFDFFVYLLFPVPWYRL